MSDEQIQAWERFRAAAVAAWEAIVQTVHDFLAAITRWWKSLPPSLRHAIVRRTQPMMRRKIRRYAREYARLR